MNRTKTYDVAIVGAGPVGLMLANELGAYGISVGLIDEGRPALPGHPRANNQSARSMEYYRRLGIADQLRQTGMPLEYPTDVTYMAGFNGPEIARVSLPSKAEALQKCREGDPVWKSAEPQLRTSQRSLVPMLVDRLKNIDCVDLLEETQVQELEQVDNGVQLKLDTNETIKARFCVGCEGARSLVRNAMDVRLGGEGGLDLDFMGGRMIASYFRSPNLSQLTQMAPAWQYWAILPDIRVVMVTLDGGQEFILHRQLPADAKVENYSLQADLDRLCGPGVEAEIISSAPWRAGQALVSPLMRKGPLFLAGDSAHLFTPTGGMGLNTGIEDAVNLAWKLAEVCSGRAGETLLESYNFERRKIALRNTGYALKLARAVGECPVAPEIADKGEKGDAARKAAQDHILRFARNEFEHPGIGLGARYDGSPVITCDGTPPKDDPITYTPSTVPGGRLPHEWIGENKSLLDLAGHSFTLIDFDAALPELNNDWCAQMGVTVHRLDRPDLAASLGARALLVRPDQFIAWRSAANTTISQSTLEAALATARGTAFAGLRRAGE